MKGISSPRSGSGKAPVAKEVFRRGCCPTESRNAPSTATFRVRGRYLQLKSQSQPCSPQLDVTSRHLPMNPHRHSRRFFPTGRRPSPPGPGSSLAGRSAVRRHRRGYAAGGRLTATTPDIPHTFPARAAARGRHRAVLPLPAPLTAPDTCSPRDSPSLSPTCALPSQPRPALPSPGSRAWGSPARLPRYPGQPQPPAPSLPSLPAGCLPGPPGQLSSSQRCRATPTAQGHSSTSQFRIGRRRSQPLALRTGLSQRRPPAAPPRVAAARPGRPPLPRGRRELQSRPSPGGQRRRGRRQRSPTVPTMPQGGAARPREAGASGAGAGRGGGGWGYLAGRAERPSFLAGKRRGSAASPQALHGREV